MQAGESEWPLAVWLVTDQEGRGFYNFRWILRAAWLPKTIFCTQHDVQQSEVHKGLLCKHVFLIKKLTSLMLKPMSLSIVDTSDFALTLREGILFH